MNVGMQSFWRSVAGKLGSRGMDDDGFGGSKEERQMRQKWRAGGLERLRCMLARPVNGADASSSTTGRRIGWGALALGD